MKFSMVKVTESAALKEKYRFAHADLFRKCKAALLQYFQNAAKERGFTTYSVGFTLY